MAEEIPRRFLEPLNPVEKVQVKDFFKGKNVFITGATGFMGKALVEKLLWSCEDIGNLYLLIRSKREETAQQRVDDLKKSPVFSRIRQRDERVLSKLVPIEGDISDIDLAISAEERILLEEKVSVVFHAASSVRFDDPLKKAVLGNVRGTREVVELAKAMKILKVMVYVSTAYSNCDRPVIEEKFYKSHGIDWRTMINSVETQDERTLKIITPKIIGAHANTYTFSKNLAESVVYEAQCQIPVLIFRPSIVSSSLVEPIPGWADNLNGPIGIGVGYLTGVVHCVFMDGDKVMDYIPCDYATNALIASTWYRGLINTSDCVIIHSASGDKQSITANRLFASLHLLLEKMPLERVMWHPSVVTTSNRVLYYILFYFTHLLPAVILDIILRMKGEKFRMMKLYQKIFLGNEALSFFSTRSWKIENKNSDLLRTFLHPEDVDIFPFDVEGVKLSEGCFSTMLGIKQYILHEDTSEASLAINRKKNKKFKVLHYIVKGCFYSLVCWILYKCIALLYFKFVTSP